MTFSRIEPCGYELADVHANAACLESLTLRDQIGGTAAVRIDEDRGDALCQQRYRVHQDARPAPRQRANARR